MTCELEQAARLLRPYHVRRIPYPMQLGRARVPWIVDPQRADAAIADPGARAVDAERTRLAERAFQAGARAMLIELRDAGLLDVAAVLAKVAARGAAAGGDPCGS